MCGIAGLFRWGDRPDSVRAGDQRRVEAMTRALDHRGPDDRRVTDLGQGVILGHTRLSILDLTDAATQPMAGLAGMTLVYNGELYNFAWLRRALEVRGAAFTSTGDTEVLLRSLELDWDRALQDLDGMFAFAVFDARKKRLLLARDRLGKKPLFIHHEREALLFASEIGALKAGGVAIELDPDQLAEYLIRGYVPDPRTLCRGIEQLGAAEAMLIEGSGAHRRWRYWQHPWLRGDRMPEPEADAERAAPKLTALLDAAVARRLASDVPLGAFLSGGVDSAAVVALAQKHVRQPLQTFTIGFAGAAEWDETGYARQTSAILGTRHKEQVLRPDLLDVLPALTRTTGEPQGDSSLIPTYLVSRLARKEVKVVLTGDGGDELFAGYDRFLIALAASMLPRFGGRVAGSVLGPITEGPAAPRTLRRMKRWARALAIGPAAALMEWAGGARVEDVEGLVRRPIAIDALAAPEMQAIKAARKNGASRLHALLAANIVTYLPNNTLVKVDRASMANGLEARSPFLDIELLEYAATLAPALLARGLSLKWVLKRALAAVVPEAVLARKKRGFGAPVGVWFRGQAGAVLKDRLLSGNAKVLAAVDPATLRGWLSAHASGREDHGILLWRLWALDEWLRWASTGGEGETIAGGRDEARLR